MNPLPNIPNSIRLKEKTVRSDTMLFPREIWKPVVNYEGLYEVSSVGRVRNKASKKELKVRKDKDGYLIVNLYEKGKIKTCKVHRLVAQSFIPNQENKPQVDHINTIRTDNYYKNLKWVTPRENSRNELSRKHYLEVMKSEEHKRKLSEANKGENNPFYGRHHTEDSKSKISKAKKGKLCGEENPFHGKHHSEKSKRKMSKPVEIFKDKVSLGIFYGCAELSRRSEELFGIKLLQGKISAVCRGEVKSHKGFTFRYVDE